MKYNVIETSYRTWIVEKETGEDYFVSFNGRLPRAGSGEFKCSCPSNSLYKKECKHILVVKNYLNTGRKEFDL